MDHLDLHSNMGTFKYQKMLNTYIEDFDLHSNLVIFKSLSLAKALTIITEFTFQSGDIQIGLTPLILSIHLSPFTFQSGDILMTFVTISL